MNNTYVALLRGINVGGKNKVPMKDLAATFTEAGCENVRTYIQSGNVIFRGPATVASRAVAAVSERWGAPVVLRTAEQLRQAVTNNPFTGTGAPDTCLHIMFLTEPIDPGTLAPWQSAQFAPEKLAVAGREIYLYLPDGAGRSKLLRGGFDRKLNTVCTMRNWRTTTKLLELASVHR